MADYLASATEPSEPTALNSSPALPSLKRAIVTGGLGFGFGSLCVFATVAFGERWMYTQLGVLGAYLT